MEISKRQKFVASKAIPLVHTVVISGLSVLLGGLIYVVWRPIPPAFITWIKNSEVRDLMSAMQQGIQQNIPVLPDWMVYSLPNAFWAFAYSYLLCNLWYRQNGWEKWLWVSTAPMLPIGWEVLQYFSVLPGTFCWLDLSLGLIGACIGIVMGKKRKISS